MALQGKNRNVRGNDDEHREQGGASHLVGGINDDLPALALSHVLFVFSQTVHDVFHHDHRTVHNDAKVHGAQAQ